MEKSMGQAHNELLAFMMDNHDISTFSTFDSYIEYQYEYLIAEHPELSEYNKEEFVRLVLSTLNSNNISEFDYKESTEVSLKRAKDAKVISDRFYSEAIQVLNDESVDGSNLKEKIGSINATNQVENDCIAYALDVEKFSKPFWENKGATERRNWVTWGADVWGGFVAGTLVGTLTVNPVVGYLAGLAGGELMSACVGAAQGIK